MRTIATVIKPLFKRTAALLVFLAIVLSLLPSSALAANAAAVTSQIAVKAKAITRTFAGSSIGAALDVTSIGRQVTYDLYIENLGSTILDTLAVDDDLDAVFGAGNYTVIAAPVRFSGSTTVSGNSAFDGSTDTQLLATGGTLDVGALVRIQWTVEINTVVDLGSGSGVYTNQITVTGRDPVYTLITDISDSGTEPDANNNDTAGDAGEDDATLVSLLENPKIGVAKTASLSGTQVTFDFYLKNLGNTTLSNLSLVDNLDSVFGAGNYTITSAPSFFVDDPGSITLNSGYNGSNNPNLISSGSLIVGDTAHIRVIVNVTTVSDQGSGLGVYSNQATAAGESPYGKSTSDLSDHGVNPDPQPEVDDPTPFTMGEEARIGVALNASVNGNQITLDYYLENLGNVTLNTLSLDNDLNAVFGAGNYYVSSGPALIVDPGTLMLNTAYNGSIETALLQSGSTLTAGGTAQIRLTVTLVAISDQGMGTGIYENQVMADATAPGGSFTSDYSDNGTDPDPNGNGDPADVDENDVTGITVVENARLGVALDLAFDPVTSYVTITYYLENLGNLALSNLLVDNNLNTVFGAGNFTHVEDPNIVSGTALNINTNASYNGNTNTAVFLAGSSLAAGETAVVRQKCRITNITDQGFGVGIYQMQVTANTTDPAASPVSDVSDAGTDPDPNGNGDATEAGENDPTTLDINSIKSIGAALTASVSANQITFDYYIENLGNVPLENISLINGLDQIFGAGNYSLSGLPQMITDPGTLTLNSSYDGGIENDLLVPASSTMAVGAVAQIRMQVTIANLTNYQGLGLGSYSNQATVSSTDQYSTISDTSDDGTDPDPNGNGNPNEGGENDATAFQIPFNSATGVAQTISVSGTQVTIDLYLKNVGTVESKTLSLIDDLDAVFGTGNYTITTLPMLIDDPGTLALNGSYNGSSDTELLLPGSSTLTAGDTAQIQMVVDLSVKGNFESQATLSASDASGVSMADLSDDGTLPDPNSNGDPTESSENDTNVFIVGIGHVGVAMQATVKGTVVYFDYTVENTGDIPLTNFAMEQPLNGVFGSGNYSILTQPTLIEGPATLTLSPQFFGFNIFSKLIVGGDLQPGETVRFRTAVTINAVSDQGDGFGIYQTQVIVTANDILNNPYTDNSDAGFEPDSNGNGNASDAGEEDTTWITIGDEATLGVAMNASVNGGLVTFDLYLENFGASTLSTITLPFTLDSVFGAGNYTINAAPTFVDDPGTINLNGTFDGSSNTAVIDAGSTLASTDTAQIRLIVEVLNRVDLGLGLGNYEAQVATSATAPLGTQTWDNSDNGVDPDPNANGIPWDGDESNVTAFTVDQFVQVSKVGVAETVSVQNGLVSFDFYIENFGTTTLDNFSLPLDLDALFGAGNYAISSIPTITSDVRNIYSNTAFNGSSDTELISGNLDASPTVTVVHLEIQLYRLSDQGSGIGIYSSQVTISATDPGNAAVTDLSDDGTNPDPNSNENPNEAGENDANAFTIVNSLPIANNDNLNIVEDTLDNVLDVLANDSDADSWQTLNITAVSTPNNGGSVSISGGNKLLYSPQPDFFGNESFSYTISDGSGGDMNATVNITVSNINDKPVNTALPVISGTLAVGNTLSTTDGIWTDADNDILSYSYQWLADNVAIVGAVNSSYTLTTNEAHKAITVTVTANDTLTTTSATSASVSTNNTAPTYTSLPVISGTALVGNTLNATEGTWMDADNDGLSYSYQWFANGLVISGATANSYQLSSSEAHKTITVRVTADDGTTTTQSTSTGINVGNTAPSNTGLPVISGSASVGGTLNTTDGTWMDADNDGLSYSYQWFANGLVISGATANSYTPTINEAYKTITVRVGAYDGTLTTEATSAATTPITIPPITAGDDRDYDGITNAADNCPNIANPLQGDLDGDGIGNLCDPSDDRAVTTPTNDTDGDGIEDSIDNCPTIPNANQADIDGDGSGDVCDTISTLQDIRISGVAYSGPFDPGGIHIIPASIAVTTTTMPTVPQGAPTPPSEVVAPVNIVSDSGGVLGYMITVVFTIPKDSDFIFTAYWKYGKETVADSDHWYDYGTIVQNDNGTGYSVSADGKTMTVSLFDGVRGDDDLSANGHIVDPGAPIVSRAAVNVPLFGPLGIAILSALLGLVGMRRLKF